MSSKDAMTQDLKRMLKECPACKSSLAKHRYAQFACTVASEEDEIRLADFVRTVRAHEWRPAREFKEFKPLLDAFEAFALRCVSGTIVLLLVRDPFELFDSSSILDCEILDTESGKELEAVIESIEWENF